MRYHRNLGGPADLTPSESAGRGVSPDHVKVDYIRSDSPQDKNDQRNNGEVADSYTIKR